MLNASLGVVAAGFVEDAGHQKGAGLLHLKLFELAVERLHINQRVGKLLQRRQQTFRARVVRNRRLQELFHGVLHARDPEGAVVVNRLEFLGAQRLAAKIAGKERPQRARVHLAGMLDDSGQGAQWDGYGVVESLGVPTIDVGIELLDLFFDAGWGVAGFLEIDCHRGRLGGISAAKVGRCRIAGQCQQAGQADWTHAALGFPPGQAAGSGAIFWSHA